MSSSEDEPTAAGSLWKSDVSAGTSDCGVNPFPPPLPPEPSRLPRNCTDSAMISTDCRLPPPSLASHSRHSRRPCTATGRPFDRYVAQFCPCAPHTVTSKKLGLSSHSPVLPFLRRLLTATRSLQTEFPLEKLRSSGSRVRLPVM